MPAMVRWEKKATKIAYKLLGVPSNIRSAQQEKNKKKSNIERRLVFEETTRVR